MISLASRAILLVSSKNKDVAPKKPGRSGVVVDVVSPAIFGFFSLQKDAKRKQNWPMASGGDVLGWHFSFSMFHWVALREILIRNRCFYLD